MSATDGVTLGGQTFGDETTTGTLPTPSTTPLAPVAGTYTVPAARRQRRDADDRRRGDRRRRDRRRRDRPQAPLTGA